MTTEAATQIAAHVPVTLPAAGAAPFTAAALAAAGLTEPAAPVEAVEAEPDQVETRSADAALVAANKIKAKREAQRRAEHEAAATSARLSSELAEERRARAEVEARQRRYDDDPSLFLKEKKIGLDAAAKAAIEAGSVEARLAEEREARLALERRLSERDAREARAASEQRTIAGRRAYVDACKATTTDGDATKPLYPHLSAHLSVNPDAVILQMEAIAMTARERTGQWPSPDKLREYQEWLYSEAAAKMSPAAPLPPTVEASPTAPKPAAKAARALASRAAVPATVPKSFDEMSPKEMRDAMAAQLKGTIKPA